MHKFIFRQPLIAKCLLPADIGSEFISLINNEIKIGRQLKEDSSKLTFLQRLVLNQQQHAEQITDRDITTHTFGNITAGSDTTAIAMQSVILNLIRNPTVYRTLCEEVRSSLTELPVQFHRANELPYLTAVVKEAIRIHPSVGMMLARTVPTGGAEICGFHIPAGTEVGMNPWVLHRDESIFSEPNEFRPERWISSSEQQLSLMNRSFMAFGHGPHTCSGRWISMMETMKLIPTLLLHFDLEIVNDAKDFKMLNRWFIFQTGINVRLISRDFSNLRS